MQYCNNFVLSPFCRYCYSCCNFAMVRCHQKQKLAEKIILGKQSNHKTYVLLFLVMVFFCCGMQIILNRVQVATVLPVVTFRSILFCYYSCAARGKGVIIVLIS